MKTESTNPHSDVLNYTTVEVGIRRRDRVVKRWDDSVGFQEDKPEVFRALEERLGGGRMQALIQRIGDVFGGHWGNELRWS